MPMGSSCVATTVLCGNGVIDSGESCDDGRAAASGDGCSMTCQVENNVIREACVDTAASIQVRSGQTVRVRGTTVGRTNNGSGSGPCNATGPEVVLRIRAVDGGMLSVAVTPLAPTWDVVVRAGGGCPGSMCIDSMSASATETYTQSGVAGGSDIDVVIDGFNGAAGAYDAVIRLM
jgi:cysteine-rich repeat protein